MPHDHHGDFAGHSHGHNHTHTHDDHLHSHPIEPGKGGHVEEIRTLAESFMEGFRQATDKTSYLRVAGVPFQRLGADGLTQNLVDAEIRTNWQLGSASPGFASRELVYMPYPGQMVREREHMVFTYVSLTERADVDLLTFLAEKIAEDGAAN